MAYGVIILDYETGHASSNSFCSFRHFVNLLLQSMNKGHLKHAKMASSVKKNTVMLSRPLVRYDIAMAYL